MEEKKRKINLTDDPLTNIQLMIPMMNEKEKEAMSYLMYGCCLGKELADKETDKKAKPDVVGV